MSRVGGRPIKIPSGIKVGMAENKLVIEGKGKTQEYVLFSGVTAEVKDNTIILGRPSDSRKHKALHGTVRSLIQNIIIGLDKGFQKKLLIQGVGYKARLKGKALVLDIGFSHSITFNSPQGITIELPSAVEIVVKGIDKQKVGEAAAEIRNYYPPEPYKGKGIRYEGEYVRQKQGKSVA
ncbi:MAG: 50S ribosomal protein L6 [Candidatus Omnitrophota bacterium]